MATLGKTVRIGGASGFWGDAALATAQLLADDSLDFIVYDYLAEITMAILARIRAKNPDLGYASDFISSAMAPNLAQIAQQRVRIISNAGGMNPLACADSLRAEITRQNLDLSVAVVTGDDLLAQRTTIAAAAATDMFTGAAFPDPARIGSINVYLGAFPIAAALNTGADIVITGRCVDSALTLAALIHAFGWRENDLDRLAGGSLAGHILECGPQATGGNFTDWRDVAGDLGNIGYPIAMVCEDGDFTLSKPANSGGKVSRGTVAEQLIYEIGDPQAYLLPDVACDFSQVSITETGVELIGADSQLGAARQSAPSQEVAAKIAVRHPDAFGINVFIKEATGLGLAAPPGLCGFAGARPKPSPVLALFSYLTPKSQVDISIISEAGNVPYRPLCAPDTPPPAQRQHRPKRPEATGKMLTVRLIRLAWARSGDKGDSVNIDATALEMVPT